MYWGFFPWLLLWFWWFLFDLFPRLLYDIWFLLWLWLCIADTLILVIEMESFFSLRKRVRVKGDWWLSNIPWDWNAYLLACVCMRVTDSLCSTVETDTALKSDSTPIEIAVINEHKRHVFAMTCFVSWLCKSLYISAYCELSGCCICSAFPVHGWLLQPSPQPTRWTYHIWIMEGSFSWCHVSAGESSKAREQWLFSEEETVA